MSATYIWKCIMMRLLDGVPIKDSVQGNTKMEGVDSIWSLLLCWYYYDWKVSLAKARARSIPDLEERQRRWLKHGHQSAIEDLNEGTIPLRFHSEAD